MSTATVTTIGPSSGGASPALMPMAERMKPNSPTCPSERPAVTERRGPLPESTPDTETAISCAKTTAAKIRSEVPRWVNATRGSTVMPMDTKKIAANVSRRGLARCSTISPLPDSATSVPAKNAPSATEKPAASAARARPKQSPMQTTTRSSVLRRPTTKRTSRGTTKRPTMRMSPSTSASFPITPPIASALSPSPAATAVSTAASTIASTSWITSMLMTCSRTSGPGSRSSKTFDTSMVLEMAIDAPRKIAAFVSQPSA